MIITFNKQDGNEVMASIPLPAIYVMDNKVISFPQAGLAIYFQNKESAKSTFGSFSTHARENTENDSNFYENRFDFSIYQK